MLNQFVGIAKVLEKNVSFNPLTGCDTISFKVQLCGKETKEEYIFDDLIFKMVYDEENQRQVCKYNKINVDDIISFKGHFHGYSTMVMKIDKIVKI